MSTPPVILSSAKAGDIEDQAWMLAGWDQSYTQLESGSFEAKIQSARFAANSCILRKQTNRKLHKLFSAPAGTITVAVQLSESSLSVFQGGKTGAGDVLVIPAGHQVEMVCHGFFDVVAATYATGAGAALAGSAARFAGPTVLKGDEGMQLGRWLTATLASLQADTHSVDAQAQALLRDEMRDKCNETLARLQCVNHEAIMRRQAMHIVAEARKTIDDALGSGNTVGLVAEVAGKIGVSLRTLEYSFAEVLGVSPLQYMKYVRLNRSRRDLRCADDRTTVAQTAMKWGFWHLGRYAESYRSFFGEHPSRTLRDKQASRSTSTARGGRPARRSGIERMSR